MASSIVPLAMSAVSTVVSAVGEISASKQAAAAAKAGGRDARRVANWEAEQLRQRAGQERAAAQREAIERRRQGELAVSRARALAGASGAAAFEDIFAGLEAGAEYNVQSALYEGEEAARGYETQAAGRQ